MSKKSYLTRSGGFTLVELLVVMAIILIVVSLGTPVYKDFRNQKELRDSAQIIQGIFLRARSIAISRNQSVFLVFFAQGGQVDLDPQQVTTVSIKRGSSGSIFIFENSVANGFQQLARVVLPEQVFFAKPEEPKVYAINKSGMVFFSDDKDNDPEKSNLTDIILLKKNQPLACYCDISRNTGQVSFAVRNPAEVSEE